MNPVTLALAAIRSRPLGAALCIVSAAAGIALMTALFLLSQTIGDGMTRNADGVDVVVGAKGSPLQLVLSSVYHADVPTGNIEAADADKLSHHPQVARAIPLALGDNYRGWRIVGTSPDYLLNYHAGFATGDMWQQPFEAVAGATTGLKVGDTFAGVHGLSADSDDVHNFHLYKITGVLKPSGTVLDRLILTSVDSVQQLHAHPDAGDPDAAEEVKIGHQVTALLLKVKSPLAVMTLPREINRTSNLLAASPSYEMTRLAQSLGFGRDVATALAAGFIALSGLTLLSTLASSLAARRYDLAVLRVLGASPLTLFATVMAEGLLLAGSGALLGVIFGHLAALAAVNGIASLQGLALPAQILMPQAADALFITLGLGVGLLAGIVPAVAAAKTDIAALLARGRA